jgi:hypothetical protein
VKITKSPFLMDWAFAFQQITLEPLPHERLVAGKAGFVCCSLSCVSQQSKATLRLTRASFGLALPLYCHRFLSSAVAVKLWLSPHTALLLTAALSVLSVASLAFSHGQPSRSPCYARLRGSCRTASRLRASGSSWLALASARSGFAL